MKEISNIPNDLLVLDRQRCAMNGLVAFQFDGQQGLCASPSSDVLLSNALSAPSQPLQRVAGMSADDRSPIRKPA